MRISDFLPNSEVPRSGNPESCERHWFGKDSQARRQAPGESPAFGDITYSFNSRGYRCAEFDARAAVRIVSIGCSWTFGEGLPQDALFHEVVATRVRSETGQSVVNWNLAIQGASNDYIARLLHLAVPVLDPHLVLVLFTRIGRREYLAANGRLCRYNAASAAGSADPVATEIAGHLSALTSEGDDLLNFFRNYKSVEALLSNRSWVFSLIKPNEVESVTPHLDRSRQARAHRIVDRARDGVHPGPETHGLIAQGFWQKMVETGAIDRLRTVQPA